MTTGIAHDIYQITGYQGTEQDVNNEIAKYSWIGTRVILLILAGLSFYLTAVGGIFAQDLPLERITLPPGFQISVFAENLEGPRSLALGRKGTLFVGTRHSGKVYAVVDRNMDGKADKTLLLDRDLNMPNGVAFRDGSLYVAEVNRVLRYDDIESRLNSPPEPVVVFDGFPRDRHHGWKFIRFGPDGLLYVPVGAPCNVCDPEDGPYASITRIRHDATGFEFVAHGVRNSVGFDWHPRTGELWFTDNGRDWLGDDLPPDELNRVTRPGLHFGFPYCFGKSGKDPKYGKGKNCDEFTPAQVELGAHVAPLGMRFYTGRMFPKSYENKIFIAEHGSWNRSIPVGYRIVVVDPEARDIQSSLRVFAEGWLRGHLAWGRPVDLLVMPDGSMLVSDDEAGVIYRITFSPEPGAKGMN